MSEGSSYDGGIERVRIQLERSARGYPDRLRAYRVMLDETEVGRVRRGGTFVCEAEEGHHEMHLRIDWARSATVALDLSAGEEARLACWPNARPFTAIYWLSLGHRRYIGLKLLGAGK